MMLLKQLFLAFAGITAGGVIAAGIFAFLAIIGVFPRVIDKTKTRRHIMLYETLLILGGSIGNALDLLEFPIPIGSIPAAGHVLGLTLLGLAGLSFGAFIGCHVPGGNGEGGSRSEPASPAVSGNPVHDTVHRTGQDDRFPALLLQGLRRRRLLK